MEVSIHNRVKKASLIFGIYFLIGFFWYGFDFPLHIIIINLLPAIALMSIPLTPKRFLTIYIIWFFLFLLGVTGIISIILLTLFDLKYSKQYEDKIITLVINCISLSILIFLLKELFRSRKA
jgi:hypothetical protein